MAIKTWKIGERCKGGIITIETGKTQVKVINKNFFTGAIISEVKFGIDEYQFGRMTKLEWYLNTLTTSYDVDLIMNWIRTKVHIERKRW